MAPNSPRTIAWVVFLTCPNALTYPNGPSHFDSHFRQTYNLDMDDVQTETAASPPASSHNASRLLDMYRQMVLCRTLDERVWMLNRQGKAAIVASAQGHEAAQIGSVHALRIGQDHFYIYYRDLAVLVALGLTPREIMLGFTAKAGEPLAGARQFPTHGASPRHHMVNLSNVVGTQIPQAVGFRPRLEDARRGHGDHRLLRRRRVERRRLPRGDELRRRPQAASHLPLREQWLRDLSSPGSPDGRRQCGWPG